MASIERRNNTFRVRIHRPHQKTISKTFLAKQEALQWAKQTEAQIALGIYDKAPIRNLTTFSEAASCYQKTHSIHKKNYQSEVGILKILSKRWSGLSISQVGKPEVIGLREELISKGRSGSTINHYFNAISKVYQMLANEWGIKISNPTEGIKRMALPQGRIKRINGKTEDLLLGSCSALGYDLLGAVIQFAIETGMRRGEMMGLNWSDVDIPKRKVYLHTSKNGLPRQVPLTQKAVNVLLALSNPPVGKVFNLTFEQLRGQFNRATSHAHSQWDDCDINPFDDLHFHDLRHEALSRFSDLGLNVIELSHISGHKTLTMLKRYVHCSHQALLQKLDSINICA